MALDSQKLLSEMADQLSDLRIRMEILNRPPFDGPWSWKDVDVAFPSNETAKEQKAGLPAWRRIEGLTKAKELLKLVGDKTNKTGSFGPIRLRKTADDLLKGEKDFKDVKGATIGFSDNLLVDGHGAWNSPGVLYYPLKFRSLKEFQTPGESLGLEFGPVVDWKLAEVEGSNKKDVQELTFSLPATFRYSPGSTRSALWLPQAKPYFQTDFGFHHRIYGAEASVEYVGYSFGSDLYLGGFQNLWASESAIQYQLRLKPKLDYSTTERAGPHTSRKEGDGWFRAGGLASLDFRLGGKSYNPLDVGASYEFMETLSGSGDFSNLFKAHSTWWLSEFAGITLEYSNGETPVAIKKIEQITLGLEVKY